METDIASNSGVVSSAKIEAAQKAVKQLPASKAAEIIVKGIEKNRNRILVGSDAKFMDFLYRLSPEIASKIILKKMKDLIP